MDNRKMQDQMSVDGKYATFRGVATGVDIGIYTPPPPKKKISPSKLFMGVK